MKKYIKVVTLILVLVFFLSSCINNPPQQEQSDFLYNALPTEFISSKGNYLYYRDENIFKMKCLGNENVYDFIRDPLFNAEEEKALVNCVFAGDKYLYYVMRNGYGCYQVIQRHYKTFEEKVLYEKTFYNEDKEIFLGAVKTKNPGLGELMLSKFPSSICVINNSLILFNTQSIEKINLDTKEHKIIFNEAISNIDYGYYKGVLYFIDMSYSLYQYDLKNESLKKFDNVKALNLLVTPDAIYYSNANDKGKLYGADYNFTDCKKILDKRVLSMDYDKENLYFLPLGEENIYLMNGQSNECSQILSLSKAFSIYKSKSDNMLYVSFEDNNGSLKFNTYCL